MRCRESALVISACLLTGLGVAPLAAQPSSAPLNIHTLQQLHPAPPAQIQNTPDVAALAFDAESKEYDASPGERVAPFTFNVTNIWTNDVLVERVHGSCGCTTATMPADPWRIPPKGGGPVQVRVNLAGKMGLGTKTLTFYYKLLPDMATVNVRVVNLVVNVPPPPSALGTMSEADRKAAMIKAVADAQAIFKGDCARCHVDKGRDAMGQELYAADCGICHESSHRERIVPDLHALKQETDFDYWKMIITMGKPHTMMPAFATAQGGPLTEAQIVSLATYLNHTISHNFSATASNVANAPIEHATAVP
ncbi:MAG TPA: c-type cytochrome [Verrucomicrobiae bacterium]|jgi:mono/diheme cytochrome c family protein|nr:c-type cytochrome [Verrucomicrobiae bacterium]